MAGAAVDLLNLIKFWIEAYSVAPGARGFKPVLADVFSKDWYSALAVSSSGLRFALRSSISARKARKTPFSADGSVAVGKFRLHARRLWASGLLL
jgi:hypothetical protein